MECAMLGVHDAAKAEEDDEYLAAMRTPEWMASVVRGLETPPYERSTVDTEGAEAEGGSAMEWNGMGRGRRHRRAPRPRVGPEWNGMEWAGAVDTGGGGARPRVGT